ncbi:MAG: tRNA (adenosine(37)-N6)-threonylcarbamoyltransferase complex transferase subunit TsaD, partial [Ardenticatenaceae bacterium]
DDAAGEAFDKVARMLGLPYPGGPPIQREATKGNPRAFDFPRSTPGAYDFSFSGLKTAVLREVEQFKPEKEKTKQKYGPAVVRPLPVANLAASFQQAVVDVLVERVVKAAQEFEVRQTLIAGGVAANEPLRKQMQATLAPLQIPVFYPPIALCTDNAAAIAAAAYWRLIRGQTSPLSIEVAPSLKLV